MSEYNTIIQDLLSGITDPAFRIEFMRTLQLIKEAYIRGHPEEEVTAALIDVIKTILLMKGVCTTEEEATEKAKEYAEKIKQAAKAEQTYWYVQARFRFRF